jgi:hypothetical protein
LLLLFGRLPCPHLHFRFFPQPPPAPSLSFPSVDFSVFLGLGEKQKLTAFLKCNFEGNKFIPQHKNICFKKKFQMPGGNKNAVTHTHTQTILVSRRYFFFILFLNFLFYYFYLLISLSGDR